MIQICAKCWKTMFPEDARNVDGKVVCGQCEKVLLARRSMKEDKDE